MDPGVRALLTVLKAARLSAQHSQMDLSLKMGKSSRYIPKMEKVTRLNGVVAFIEFATALGIDSNELFEKVTDQIATG